MANQAKSKTTKVTKKSSKKKLKASVNKSTKQTVNADQQFSVFGLMTHSDATPAAGMVVLAYDNDVASQDLLGQAVTDAKGAYAISYNEAQFKRTKKERDGADIVVSILNAQQKVLFTSKKKNNAPAKYELNIQLPIEQLVVRGQVRLPNGSPCAGALVRAFDKDMRSKEPLGKSKAKPITTDKEGRFEITYTAEQFIRAEKSAADILIEARQNKDAKWTATPIRYNAQPFEIINITLEGVVDRGTSEFQRLLDEISPLLDGVTIAQLKENTEFQDITFLSNETGFNKQLIELLKVSAQLAEEQTFLKHEEFYGLIRQKNIPTEMSALIELETDVLRGALQSSARDNIVRQMSEQDFADFVSRVLQLKASRVLLPSKPSEPGSLGDLLAVAVDSKKHDLVAKYYMEHDGATDAFWKDLGADKSIKPNELKALKLTFTLGDLTNKHLPLVRELYQMGKDKPAFADVKGFAQLDEVEWQAILERPQDPNDKKSKPIGFPPDQESIESYARTLNQYIENAFPTAVISNRIKRENSKEGPFKETRSDLLVFFANNPEFSFADTPPNLYLSGDTSEKFREIKNPDALKAQLKGMGRVFNITPRYSEMRALLADNLDSAMAMTRVGERKYADKYAAALGGPDKARESFRRAEHVHATTFNLLMKHSEAFNSPLPYAISGGRMKKPSTTSLLSSHRFALPTVSDYSTLFGSLNTCSCQHCLSLYSPAAYLVDILKFIQDGPLKDGQSPLDAFLARRPDIEHIGLTCKNTNTQLPYVDLTNEILEAAIVPRSFVIAEGPDIDAVINALDNETMPAGFAAAFELKGYSLSNKASVRLEDGRGDGAWIILDKGWAYSVNYQGTNEGFRILAWPQTSWTEDELRANPEHTHDPAYIKLRSTVYPWNLPLNLPMEEMRIYLDHLGVPRYKLMESFFLGNPIGVLSDKNIAFEYLGLTNEEVDIISGVTTGGPSAISGAWDFWGLLESGNDLVDLTDGNTTHAQGDWDIVLQRISIFLQQSGLSYKELLEILGTYFINPLASAGTPGGRLFGIVSTDSEDATTCNLSKLEIRMVDATLDQKVEIKALWNRMHRFVRLWQKLGWTMRDLDKAITAFKPAINDGKHTTTNIEKSKNDDFLTQLSHIHRLKTNLNVPLVNIMSWYANIDTNTYIDQLADGQPEVTSLYQRLFRNNAVIKPLDTDFKEDATTLTGNISTHTATLVAALSISTADLSLLTTGTNAVIADDNLNLANLSQLYRVASLAKALKLTIHDYLLIQKLSDIDPFAAISATGSDPAVLATGATLFFVEALNQIRSSGYSIIELDYLLRHNFVTSSRVAPLEDTISAILNEIRSELQKIVLENTFREDLNDPNGVTTDPSGELTRKKLALLNWDSTLIDLVVATFNGSVTYEAITDTFIATLKLPNDTGAYEVSLASLPVGFAFSNQISGIIIYDQQASKLKASRLLSGSERELLKTQIARTNDTGLINATDNLLKLQDELQGEITYEKVVVSGQPKGRLSFTGLMTNARKARLDSVSTNTKYRKAVKALYDAPRAFVARYMRTFSIQDFSANLDTLPISVKFPISLLNKIYFDETTEPEQLHFIGVMTEQEQTTLLGLSTNNTDPNHTAYLTAVNTLFDKPLEPVDLSAELAALPAIVNFPIGIKVNFDATAKKLHFIGVMTEQERTTLLGLSTDNTDPNHAAYLLAIDTLFHNPDDFLTTPSVDFNTATLFDNQTTPEARFLLVLKKLLPSLRQSLSERLVVQKMAESLNLEVMTTKELMTKWVNSPTHSNQKSISEFLTTLFVDSNLNIKLAADAFPDQFETFMLMHKISTMVTKYKITPKQLAWLFDNQTNRNWLNLNDLPVMPSAGNVTSKMLFANWRKLDKLFQLRDDLPQGETLLTEIFTAVAVTASPLNKVLEMLNKGTQWELASLQSLSDPSGFNFSANDFDNELAIMRISSAIALLKRLGASADQCLSWANSAPSSEHAHQLKSLVRAKYDDTQWLELAKSLCDPLRERQRSALVAYLVQALGLRDANDLFDRFLIDVEMCPCMMTTRIKQAISTVQLFIQRSLMNLESDVALSPKEAKEYAKWRKWYRVWEANRKVLFYPENWIEPELRDDKSPFYKDLENELLQSDVTMDTAEDAFLHYLEKLDQVARLEIVGMYRQQESGEVARQIDSIDILHVFGRTYAVPHTYFYRRLEDKVWSAWEKVDLDIEGDHLIPVEWNRRLYLFWPIFTEKSKQPTKDERANNEDPKKYWEIKFAWSEYKNSKWSSKKVSKVPLHYDKDPRADLDSIDVNYVPQKLQDFSFKTRKDGEQLKLECYGTTLVPSLPPQVTPPINNTEMLVDTFSISIETGWRETWGEIQIRIYTHDNVTDFTSEPLIYFKKSVNNGGRQLDHGGDKNHLGIPGKWTDSIISETANGNNGINSYGLDLRKIKKVVVFWRHSNISDAWSFKGLKISAKLQSGETVSLLINGVLEFNIDPEIWLFNPSDFFQAWEGFISVPDSPTSSTNSTQQLKFEPMQGIGEFIFDDCNGGLSPAQGPLLLSPSLLEPIQGTTIQSMSIVESKDNFANTLGAMAILGQTPGESFRVLLPHQGYIARKFSFPFFFQDKNNTYYVPLRKVESGGVGGYKLLFTSFFHPRMRELIKSLNRFGLDGLLTLVNQRLTDSGSEFMKYLPNPSLVLLDSVEEFAPRQDIDFDHYGAYSIYNWELFFHTPFLIAIQLSKNQRFEEAQKWFHYIFDPTATDSPDQPIPGPERFWRVKPFYEEAIRGIQTLDELIKDAQKIDDQIKHWEADPFKPHVIARLRVVAYMKAVVMRYIDNLIAWGDQLFRRDTMESINEATQLYVLAAQILGKRPESIPARAIAKTQTFHTLDDKGELDKLSNASVEIESFLPPSISPISVTGIQGGALLMPFFCITANDKLLSYWDTVGDRLFKIRHCMNIDGIERTLPTFEPEIDPGLLVRAAAAGVDIASALNDINAAVPHYRFNVMVQKATELCNDVKALGGEFLSALEKRDAEALALIRSGHEFDLLKAVREIKAQQVNEAKNTLQGLMKYQDVVSTRQQYYLSRQYLNPLEAGHIALVGTSLAFMGVQVAAEAMAAVSHLFPDAKIGFVTTAGTTYGGRNIGNAVQAFGTTAGITSSMLNTGASLSATLGGYQRRQDDWTHQAVLATKELKQVEKQIATAEIRLAISELELQNHDLQTENSKEVDEFMRDKFTNKELYSWMVGQLSGIYFQSYQLAYDVAKRAERTYRFELGLRDSNFIQFGYWDSLKKGLLSGERLHHDLKRMDVAYLDQNKREYEITKHISLITIDPINLIKLKETGECIISLPEALFDLDYPGHYMRRIKAVSISIPCVTGPYTGVNCTLTKLNSSIRHNNISSGKYAREGEDSRFTDSFGSIESIVTSVAQNDNGLFEANLRDERYLPFEGQGAISTWKIQLPMEFKSFDYNTISDVVLHLRYTAREGGAQLKQKAVFELNEFIQNEGQQGLAKAFSLRHEFSSGWYRFLYPESTNDQTLTMALTKERFPYLFQGKSITIKTMELLVKIKPEFSATHNDSTLKFTFAAGTTAPTTPVLKLTVWNGLLRNNDKIDINNAPGEFTLKAWLNTNSRFDPEAIQDILVVCQYTCP